MFGPAAQLSEAKQSLGHSPLRCRLFSLFCQVEDIRAVWLLRHTFQQNLRGWRKRLNATKKNPGSPRSGGLCRWLPQLVGFFDPGGGVRGMGMPPGSGLSIQS